MTITIIISSVFLLYNILMYILNVIKSDFKPITLRTTIIKNYITSYSMHISFISSIILVFLIKTYSKTLFELLGVIGTIYIIVDYLVKCIC